MKEVLDILVYFKSKGVVLSLDAEGQRLEATGSLKSLTAADKETITNNREAIIEFLANAKQAKTTAIRALPQQASYALSSAQRRLWVLSLFDEANTAYNMVGVYMIEGNLDTEALRYSFGTLIARHESLRTQFKEDEQGELRQFVLNAEELGFSISQYDWRKEATQEALLHQAVLQAYHEPFDLAAGPLLRASLYQIADRQWVFAYTMHHIISDGWSMGVLMNELQQLYASRINGVPNPLEPLRIQYKDYAAWQQEQLKGNALQFHKQYWLQQLAGELPVSALIGDKPRPTIKTYNGALLHSRIDESLTASIKALCQQQGSTLFMGLLAAVKALLYHYTGQQDIIIGSPIAGRENAELENQIGFYVNTLALRTQCNPEDSFSNLLQKVQQVTLDAYKHQAYPFDELVEALSLKRDMGRNALFDIMVILQNTGAGRAEGRRLGDAIIKTYDKNTIAESKFDITFDFAEVGDAIDLSIEYNTDIYNKATIEQLATHLTQLLAVVTAQPDTALRSISVLSEAETTHLLNQFNNTATAYDTSKTIVHLLEEQVTAQPDAIALEVDGKAFTYAALNADANQLAHYLSSKHQIGIGDVVAICLPRSIEMVLTILAIVKAGAAYLPIEPTYPQERIDYLVTDSACKIVVDETVLKNFEVDKGSYTTNNGNVAVQPTDAVYIIYTSGSTGRPKGVLVEHRNLVSLLQNFDNKFKLKPGMAMAGITNYTFDVSVMELLGCLAKGIKLVFITSPEPEAILEQIENGNITALQATPSRLGQLLELGADTLKKLKVMLVGGEALSPYYYQQLKQLTETTAFNAYGPTEATIWATSLHVLSSEALSIGQPLLNQSIYILGPQHQLLPIGVPGEICIGGAGVARGYLNRPELTAEKFIANPYVQGGRIYKTGDLGRWLPDGNIEYLGRGDQQVKVRGYRIELGEIEAALQSYPGIELAVVHAFDSPSGDKELAAYVVSNQAVDMSALRDSVSLSLPAYMVPGYFVQLDAMPLNTSGKVDRSKLPLPQNAGMAQTEYVAPRNSTEEQLVNIWKQVLSREVVGVRDNFFDLGGQSLKATRLVSLIYKTFEVKLALKDIFAYPVPEQQALLIQKTAKTAYIDIVHIPDQDYYALSAAQKRLYFLQEFALDSTGYNMTMVKYLGKQVDTAKMANAMQQLINRHESLRTSFEKLDGTPWQKVHPVIDFELEAQNCTPEAFEGWLQGYVRPFNLAEAPLMRSAIVHIETVGYAWVVDMHHIISDGTSQEILADDFMQLYQGIELEPLELQYRDFSTWQNNMIENETLHTQVQYWQKQFEDGIPKLDFVADRPRPQTFTFEGANYPFTLGAELTDKIRKLCQQHHATLQMTLLSALNVLLHKYTGQDDMVIGCGIAGRRHADVERIAGMFVNSMAIRTFPEGGKRFNAFLREVKAASLGAYENQDVQFEDLLDMLRVDRDPSHNPVFDISLIVQNFEHSKARTSSFFQPLEQPHPSLPSLQKYDAGTSKFDMDWFVEETENDIAINIEYYAAIFNKSTIERLATHYCNLLNVVLDNPDIILADINLLAADEIAQMLEQYVPGKKQDWPQDATIHSLFEKQCFQHSAHIAVESATDKLSYQALNERSNQLSKFLLQQLGLQPEARVGVLQSPGIDQVVSVMGILKAGGVYVPLDSEYPEDRLLYIIEDAGIEILLTEKKLVELSNKLQWRTNNLQHLICTDSDDFYAERGMLKNDLMRKDLWDHIGELAEDAIGQGGWINSYTGEDFSPAEMEEYSNNIHEKLKAHLRSDMRVLEIGCSSGLTMFNLAPQVGSYFGTDLSSAILEKTAQAVAEKKIQNITLACMPADQIDTVPENDFDLVIINSVIQCFNGHNYLRDVLVKAIGKMKNTGLLFVGDIMDEDRRQALEDDMLAFKKANQHPGWHTKTDWSQELFVSKDYLNDLKAANVGIVEAVYTDKIHTLENELTKFRFDALLRIDKQARVKPTAKKKYQYDLNELRKRGTDLVNAGVKPNHLACIIYTSGTTGRPKGVSIEHGALVARLLGEQQLVQASDKTVTCTATNLCFDVSLLEILLPLVVGGKIAVLPKETILSPQDLIKTLEERKVTLLQGTPSFINGIVLEGLDKGHQLSLTHIAIGGESLNEALVKQLQQRLPGVTINNQYGPTEAVIDAIVLKDVQDFQRNIIGKPIFNTNVYVLDENNHLLPLGAVGELCIGGSILARGYFNREELTAEKFIASPFNTAERLYRTGDLGRYLPDGNIEFIGRKDDQVKVRGYRIELGEIEAALLTHQRVEAAIVMAKANKQGDKELVAYIAASQPLEVADVKAHVGKMLPAYMLPAHFVQLPVLPLTANGKIDRKRLPEPEGLGTQSGHAYVAPRNETEAQIAEIWQEILGIEKVGVTDNFFEVGGHSLRVIRVLSKLRAEFGVDIKIEDVFSNPTIEYIAKEVSRKQWAMKSLAVKTDEKTVITI